MSDVTLKYPLWQNHYLQAMAETRPELLKSKISAAEQALSLRLRQLASITDDYEEQMAATLRRSTSFQSALSDAWRKPRLLSADRGGCSSY
jgi:hypothetical protein